MELKGTGCRDGTKANGAGDHGNWKNFLLATMVCFATYDSWEERFRFDAAMLLCGSGNREASCTIPQRLCLDHIIQRDYDDSLRQRSSSSGEGAPHVVAVGDPVKIL